MLNALKGGALVALFLALSYMFYADALIHLPGGMNPENVGRTRAIGMSIFTLEGYVVPFEIIGLLLLAAMIGGLIIAKEDAPQQ
ncbi:MAG: NADH-quinone oxidoreductase subunit J [Candidatus Hydrothermarchaeaceae archaeon]